MLQALTAMLILISICFIMLAGHVAFTSSTRKEARFFLTLFLLLFGLQVIILIAETLGNTASTLWARPLIAATLPPLCYLALDMGFRNRQGARKVDILHLLPASIVLVVLFEQGNFWLSLDWSLILVQWLYGVLLIRLALRKGNRHNWVMSLTFGILFLITGVVDIWVSGHVHAGGQLAQSSELILGLGIIFFIVVGLMLATVRRPDLISRAITTIQETGNTLSPAIASSSPGADVLLSIIEKVDYCLTNNKPYKEETFGLAWLAAELSLPSRQISQAINCVKCKGFSAYINDWKIKDAAALLASPEWSEHSITEIMFEAGFFTKSSFNKEFRKRKGISPKECRQRNAAPSI